MSKQALKETLIDLIREIEAERPGMVFGAPQLNKEDVLEELYRQLNEME